jgi:FixJ family two-component response regulator
MPVSRKDDPTDSHLISIVDDDASMRNSTRRLVRSFGFKAEAFASAREFLDSGCVDRTACLILDMRMPGMDGLDLQRHLAEANHRIPIVFITATASLEEQRRAIEAGAVEFLRKPVSEQALLSAITAALERGHQDVDAPRNPGGIEPG